MFLITQPNRSRVVASKPVTEAKIPAITNHDDDDGDDSDDDGWKDDAPAPAPVRVAPAVKVVPAPSPITVTPPSPKVGRSKEHKKAIESRAPVGPVVTSTPIKAAPEPENIEPIEIPATAEHAPITDRPSIKTLYPHKTKHVVKVTLSALSIRAFYYSFRSGHQCCRI